MVAQVLRAVRLLSTGVPRLWRAARASGAGRRTALDVVLVSLLAFLAGVRGGARAGAPAGWRRQNAVRHFVWQAYLTARHGEQLAAAVGAAQEAGSPDAVDSAVDEANNRLGRAYGLAHADELRRGSRRAALAGLAEVADAKWTSLELRSAPLRDGTDPRTPPGPPRG